MANRAIIYRKAFKKQVGSELESGKIESHSQARERDGIGGSMTVAKWVDKYSSEHMKRRVVHVRTPTEQRQREKLKARIKELEAALKKREAFTPSVIPAKAGMTEGWIPGPTRWREWQGER